MGFAREEDARRVMDVLPKRFEKYGLTIHPEKTRLVPFERPGGDPTRADLSRRTPPGTFDLLGFTHYWARSRKGNRVVKRKTSASRFRRGLKALSDWCRINRHRPISEQHQTLSQKLRGHFGYYGITGNSRGIYRFRVEAIKHWRKWLARRDRRRAIPWDRFDRLLERFPLPKALAVHSAYRTAANA